MQPKSLQVTSIANADIEAMREHAAEASELMQALSNPNRLMILCSLSNGEVCVGDLNQQLALSQSALSQHLAVLRKQNLVQTRRESQTIYYSVTPGPAMEIVALLQQHFCATN